MFAMASGTGISRQLSCTCLMCVTAGSGIIIKKGTAVVVAGQVGVQGGEPHSQGSQLSQGRPLWGDDPTEAVARQIPGKQRHSDC